MQPNLHIILTGGTIAMGKNAEGHYANCYDMRHLMLALALRDAAEKTPARKGEYESAMQTLTSLKLGEEGIDAALNELLTTCGYESFDALYNYYGIARDSEGCGITKPYDTLEKTKVTGVNNDGLIDSIAFDMNLHFPKLAEATREKLSQNTGPVVVIGGTDSLEFYAPALSHHMAAKGQLESQSLHFLSAMKSFEDDPWHVASLLKGTLLAARAQTQTIGSNAFVLCPKLNNAGEVTAINGHDVCCGMAKISSKLANSFRSHAGLAFHVPLNGEARFYETPTVPMPQVDEPSRTLAPVLKDTAPDAVLAYLQALQSSKEVRAPAIVPIELSLALVRSPHAPAIANAIGALRNKNIHTLLIHPTEALHEHVPRLDATTINPWCLPDNAFITAARANGAITRTGTTADLWVQARLGQLNMPEPTHMAIATVTPQPKAAKERAIGLRYVPDSEAFAQSLKLAAAISDQIVIEALPGGALPARLKDEVEGLLQQGKALAVGFKYAGRIYGEGEKKFVEKVDSHYGESAWVGQLNEQHPATFTLLGETSPAQYLQSTTRTV
jgi:hypothetical protein